MRVLVATTLFALACTTFSAITPPSAPSLTPDTTVVAPPTVEKYEGETNGKYIVQLKDGADKASFLAKIKEANGHVTHDWDIINGFAGEFDAHALNVILASPLVESVSEDGFMTTFGVQLDAPWGLARISDTLIGKDPKDPSSLSYQYFYPDDRLGGGVDIYIIDTGVRISHETFQGRAKWGATFGGYKDSDGNGHGTHVAGIAAGFQYGVAKKANIIAVKVLSDDGSGSISDVVSGMDWAKKQATSKDTPAVVNMSLGGGVSKAIDNAARSLTSSGIHIVAAAGNAGKDAGNVSPAHGASVVTVASSTIKDERSYFSNYGHVVKLFAPGSNVVSASNASDTGKQTLSGTSMAAPHVAGLIAYLITAEGDKCPLEMIATLQDMGDKNQLTGVPPDTPNIVALNHKALDNVVPHAPIRKRAAC